MPWGIRPLAVILRRVEPSFRRLATISTTWFAAAGSASGFGDGATAAGSVGMDERVLVAVGVGVGVAAMTGITGGAGRSGGVETGIVDDTMVGVGGFSVGSGEGVGEGSGTRGLSGRGENSGTAGDSGARVALGRYGEPTTATIRLPVWRRSRSCTASEVRSRMIFSCGGVVLAGYPKRSRVTCRSSMFITSGLTRLLTPSITMTVRGGFVMGYERKEDDSRGSAQTMVMVVLPSESCPQLMASTVLAVDSPAAATRKTVARTAIATGTSRVRS
jgi:hypothetical protein